MTRTSPAVVFETPRLSVRRVTVSDAAFFHRLWTNPDVMKFVGYPKGLPVAPDEIRARIEAETSAPFDALLIVEAKESGEPIGECKLGSPDADGVAETDVKLLPMHWGNGYGVEIKRGLVAHLFANTSCRAVRATPNKGNIASRKMQEAVGGRRVGEGLYRFPKAKRDFTCPVPHYIYMVYREDWEKG